MSEVVKEDYFEAIRTRLPELDYQAGLITCAGNQEFYLELLKDFTELPIKEELTMLLKEGDSKNYCIRVHGFKNNAYTVGARKIGDLAYELEKLTKASDLDKVPQLQSHMFELYDSVCTRYQEVIVI